MFSRQEVLQLKREFWTAFGQYMKPVPLAEGEKNNWLNYKTREKDIAFKMDVHTKEAIIGIELTHADLGLQQFYFEQFAALKNLLKKAGIEDWNWELHANDENGRTISKIFTTHQDVSLLNRADWSAIISFFKPRIIALDQFWSEAKYAFEALR